MRGEVKPDGRGMQTGVRADTDAGLRCRGAGRRIRDHIELWNLLLQEELQGEGGKFEFFLKENKEN